MRAANAIFSHAQKFKGKTVLLKYKLLIKVKSRENCTVQTQRVMTTKLSEGKVRSYGLELRLGARAKARG